KSLVYERVSRKKLQSAFSKIRARVAKRGKAPKVIIVAIMRKLLCILFGMLKNSSNFDPNLAFLH
ncbi:MAG: hypothetical protein IJA14_02115, partial [Alphaproteobacteria bacterium]|nr:hypothetical protein [Alphaproteobacteria bacterium]